MDDRFIARIVTPCPVCQTNIEIHQSEANSKHGTTFAMPVTCYSQLMTVPYGGGIKEAGLDGHAIRARKLEEIAVKVVPAKKSDRQGGHRPPAFGAQSAPYRFAMIRETRFVGCAPRTSDRGSG